MDHFLFSCHQQCQHCYISPVWRCSDLWQWHFLHIVSLFFVVELLSPTTFPQVILPSPIYPGTVRIRHQSECRPLVVTYHTYIYHLLCYMVHMHRCKNSWSCVENPGKTMVKPRKLVHVNLETLDCHIGPTQDTSNCVYPVNNIHTTRVTLSTRVALQSTRKPSPVANTHWRRLCRAKY